MTDIKGFFRFHLLSPKALMVPKCSLSLSEKSLAESTDIDFNAGGYR